MFKCAKYHMRDGWFICSICYQFHYERLRAAKKRQSKGAAGEGEREREEWWQNVAKRLSKVSLSCRKAHRPVGIRINYWCLPKWSYEYLFRYEIPSKEKTKNDANHQHATVFRSCRATFNPQKYRNELQFWMKCLFKYQDNSTYHELHYELGRRFYAPHSPHQKPPFVSADATIIIIIFVKNNFHIYYLYFMFTYVEK